MGLEAKRKELLSGRSLADGEQETELTQLGITSTEVSVTSESNHVDNSTEYDKPVVEEPKVAEDSKVAQVIQAIKSTPSDVEKSIQEESSDDKDKDAKAKEETEEEPVVAK